MIRGRKVLSRRSGKDEELITVTRLNGSEFVINAEMIETIEAAPDTIITLTNKSKFVVCEGVEEIVRRVVQYKRRLRATNFGEDLNDPEFTN